MTPQRWFQIKEVFFAARETAEEDRGTYLDSACGDDPELRAEVELLLANDDASSLPRPAVDLESFAPQFASGQMLGQYRIEAKLGEGGMGAVYRAYDTRLRRPVALKVVSPGHLGDPESRQRLLREARAASALNHPNVVTVHEIGSESGRGLHRDGVGRRKDPQRGDPSHGIAAWGDTELRRTDCRRTGQGPRGGDRAPGSEARQYHGDA